jgi:hypothetical protein
MSTTHRIDVKQFQVEFVPSGRGKAQCASDPNYPHGIQVDCSDGAVATCTVALPYPAKECGHYRVECRLCHFSVALTAAGRADDPTEVKMPCQLTTTAVIDGQHKIQRPS